MIGCQQQQYQSPPNGYYFLEVVVPGVASGQTGTIFYFPSNIEQLNGAKIHSISGIVLTNGATTPIQGITKTPSGRVPLVPTSSQNIFFTLKVNGYDLISNVDYQEIANYGFGNNKYGLHLGGVVIDWSTSYVLLNPAPGNTVDNAVCFIVQYWKK